MKIHLLIVLGMMLVVNVLGKCEKGDYSTCVNGGDCTRKFKGDTCEECCDEVAPRPDRNVLCRGRCEVDDAKCSMGGNQDFLDDVVGCLKKEESTGSGLDCDECKGCCEGACKDAKPGCGGASPSACMDRCKYRRCRDVCRGGDDDDDDDDDDDTTSTTFLSSDQTRKCSNKDSEDSCEDCCENKCSNKSNSDDQLDSCKEDCIHEADCSEASSDGGSCDDKIDECCDCMDYGCDVESGDSPSKNKKDCIKDKCKNKYCKDAGDCKYGGRSKWKKVVEKKCHVHW